MDREWIKNMRFATGCESEIMSSWCVGCPWCMSPVLESRDDFSWYPEKQILRWMPRIYPSQILRSSQGELGVETESFPCKRRESMWEMSHTSRPHDGILVRCVGQDRQTRAACLSVRLSVEPNLVLSQGLLGLIPGVPVHPMPAGQRIQEAYHPFRVHPKPQWSKAAAGWVGRVLGWWQTPSLHRGHPDAGSGAARWGRAVVPSTAVEHGGALHTSVHGAHK